MDATEAREAISEECIGLVDGWIKSVEANLEELGFAPTGGSVFVELDAIRKQIWSWAQEVVKGDTSCITTLPAGVLASLLLLADAGTNLVMTRLLELGRISPEELGILSADGKRKYLGEIGG